MAVLSVHESGGKGLMVSVETSLSNSLPTILLIGFAGKSLSESRERIRSAFTSSHVPLPKKRITVNISPADVPKDGAHYDLAIALSMLQASGFIPAGSLRKTVALGELGLDGSIRPIRGIIGKILSALDYGYTDFIIPEGNYAQARLIKGVRLLASDSFKSLVDKISHEAQSELFIETEGDLPQDTDKTYYTDLVEIVGQDRAKRALEIAAAGGHNVILNGPPGVGKSMLAKALPGIMPPMTHEETITVTHLHSLASDTITDLLHIRPFRSPHHSASDVSIIGGGSRPRPGEISLAHHGILFLDELPEFRRNTIESLRQPLEDGKVTVARVRDSITYPARFLLIATKNPCPCGYYGSDKPCTCSPVELQRYHKKLSGPILDRIDIHVTVDSIDHKNLLKNNSGEQSESNLTRKRVIDARTRQMARQGKRNNSSLSNRDIKKYVLLRPEAKELLDTAAEKLQISARVYMKMIKLARTIADLEKSEQVEKNHIAEALQYRPVAII